MSFDEKWCRFFFWYGVGLMIGSCLKTILGSPTSWTWANVFIGAVCAAVNQFRLKEIRDEEE